MSNLGDKEDIIYITLYVDKKVYKLPKSFLDIHPGGKESILKKNGTNCIRDYNFHTQNGKKMWNQFLVEDNSSQCCIS